MKHPFLGKFENLSRRKVIIGGVATVIAGSVSAQRKGIMTLALNEEGRIRISTAALNEEGRIRAVTGALNEERRFRAVTGARGEEGRTTKIKGEDDAGNKDTLESMKKKFEQAIADTKTKLDKGDLRGSFSALTYARYCNKSLSDAEKDTEATKKRTAKVDVLKVSLKEPVRVLHEKAVKELTAKETISAYRKFYTLQFIREFPYATQSANSLKEIRKSDDYKENKKEYAAFVSYDSSQFVDKKYLAGRLKSLIKRYPGTEAAKNAAEEIKAL